MKTLDENSLARRIVLARKSAGLTQKDLAARVGMLASQLCKIEYGANETTARTVRRIADALNVSPSYLLGESNEEPPIKAKASDCEGDVIRVLCDSSNRDGVKSILGAIDISREAKAPISAEMPFSVTLLTANLCADEMRRRLGLGYWPCTNLEDLLMILGVKIGRFYDAKSEKSALLLNTRSHALGLALNRANDAATDNAEIAKQLGALVVSANSGYKPISYTGEVRAIINHFAWSFLLPNQIVALIAHDWQDRLSDYSRAFAVSESVIKSRMAITNLITK